MSKTGRRPRGGARMPSTTITALVEELAFMTILGNGSTSAGAQQTVMRLVDRDPEAARIYKQAQWMKERASRALRSEQPGVEANQTDLYRWIAQHYWELEDEWKDRQADQAN